MGKFWRGADVSWLEEIEARGGRYFEGSREDDCLAILKRNGINCVRLRVWNDPENGYCGLANTFKMAKRVKALDMDLLIDFHYSDNWADPGKQYKPKAWEGLSMDDLAVAVHDFTYKVLAALKDQGTPATGVQIGNEVTHGFMWEDGRLPAPSDPNDEDAWLRFGTLLKAGIDAARVVHGQELDVMVHIDRGADNEGSRFFLDHVLQQGIEFDSIGLSYYPWWHGELSAFEANLNYLAHRYAKDLVLLETAYPWTDTGMTKENAVQEVTASAPAQAAFLLTVMDIVKRVPNGLGKGVFYWEPDSIPVEGQAGGWNPLGLFDAEGRALPGLEVFKR